MKNNKLVCWTLTLALLLGGSSCTKEKAPARNGKEEGVGQLLSKMSLEEKAGQMTQIDIRNLLNDGYGNTDQKLDKAKLKEALHTYKVGSILNCIEAYTPEKWQELINEIQNEAQQTPHKIPVLYGTDAVHGVGFMRSATLFPHNIALGATRNDSLVFAAAHVTAIEARAVGLTWNFAPVLDVGRQPYWSRFEETFGEDTYMVSQMGTASVLGMESKGLNSNMAVASCLKHFLGYSAPKNGVDRTPAHIPEVVLREHYLPPFEKAVKSGAATVMINSGEINGVPTHGNPRLLTGLLRTELGFQGLACSDWEDVIRLHTLQKVAATPKEAVAIAVNAGVDMSMVPNDYSFPKYVVELVKEGKIPMSRIDEAVGRILALKLKLGLFDKPLVEPSSLKAIGSEEHMQVSLKAAQEAITLLENKAQTLPLQPFQKILLAGPCAHSMAALNSSWSYVWQGNDEAKYPAELLTLKEALVERVGAPNVLCNSIADFESGQNYDVDFIKANASKVDVIVLCLGEKAYAEQPGVINELALPAAQRLLIRAAKQTGKPVVLCLVEGRPRLFPEEAPLADAILMAYRPGNYGAQAIVDVLYGKVNPSGRLPFTYPKYNGKIMTYDYKFKEAEEQLEAGKVDYSAADVQWPFGRGLSYTTFKFGDMKVDKTTLGPKDSILVSITVLNSGSKPGKVSVELYSRDHYASITPCQKRLRAYRKVFLKEGQHTELSFKIGAGDLSFVNDALKRVTEPGAFDLMIEDQNVEVNYQE